VVGENSSEPVDKGGGNRTGAPPNRTHSPPQGLQFQGVRVERAIVGDLVETVAISGGSFYLCNQYAVFGTPAMIGEFSKRFVGVCGGVAEKR